MGRIKPSLLFPKSIQSIYRTPHDQTNLNNAGPLASHLKSRSVVRFGGPDTLKFLQGLLTNDVHKFGEPPCERDKTSTLPTPNMPYESASPVYAALLTPQGRFLYDLFLYYTPQPEEKLNQTGSGPGSGSDDGSVEVFADVDGSVLDELLQTFKKYQLRSKVEIESVAEDFSCWQHYGGNVSQKSSSIEELEAAGVGWGSGVDRLACQLHVLLILDGNGLRIPDWIVLDPEESSNLVQYDLWLKLTKKQMKRITFCGD